MPESPDLEVFAKNLDKIFTGKKLKQIKIVNTKSIKDDLAEFDKHLKGHTLKEVYRSGKELRFKFSNDVILGMHLMLNGELHKFEAKNENKNTIVEFRFDNVGLVLTDYQAYANIKLSPEDKAGIDALSEELDFDTLKKRLQSKTNIKKRLNDQNVIRGIGNAYSDEILWEAKISPFSASNKIPDDKIGDLAKAIKSVLKNAIEEILKRQPDIITGEVRDFLKIHHPKKEKSPTGGVIKVEKKGGRTYYTDEQKLYV